ncbi:DedA family protein [Parenemella sanctibonifatiensis]|uniref:DedA family protein n=1 Tax=Parenemella sanctibonifatiensis TaxID=2016505 RepID=A0A255E141_9ACTN|nr:hypothetical protein [Parenemella sanctibonifatiensis]OYN84721.1 hypothetical protein CGZ92_12940 [Parenemella sanctibonifatiensis]OYN92482.1 hypothetical protein CGZ91_03060 [Parenemella sanctibonifatiensis]
MTSDQDPDRRDDGRPLSPLPDIEVAEAGRTAAERTEEARAATEDGTAGEAKEAEREWWDDPRMPWAGKPGKQDIGCWIAIAAYGVWALVMMPLRPVLLAANPFVLAIVSGSSISMALIGAEAAVNGGWWWVIGLVLGTIGISKFDWIYWWAGKLWGSGIIDIIVGDRGQRAKRNADRAANLTKKYATLAMALTYVPFLPFPTPVVHAALGMAGTSLRKFLILDLLFALISRAGYMYLGYRIGEPAVGFLEVYGQYAWYVSIGLIVVIFAGMWWRSRRKVKAEAAAKGAENQPQQQG